MREKQGFVYILTNKTNTVLYIGVTSNLQKRVWEHINMVVEGFTKKYNIHKLVYYECMQNIEDAIAREKYLKGKNRTFKVDLINSTNPKWIDLYDSIL